MTKTDFAELKRVLCINPAISFDIPDDMQVLSIKTMKDLTVSVVDHQHTKSSAIISELIEIIKLQSEALDSINNDFGFFHHANKRYIESGKDKQDVTKIGTPIRIATGKLETCVSETTTRLQKLREGK